MSQRRIQLALMLGAVALGLGLGLVVQPDGFQHYHRLGNELFAHSHVHAGPHRHDQGWGNAHAHPHSPVFDPHRPASPSKPDPDRDDGGHPPGRYVPGAGVVAAHSAAAVRAVCPREPAGFVVPAAHSQPPRRRAESTASPRGPPA